MKKKNDWQNDEGDWYLSWSPKGLDVLDTEPEWSGLYNAKGQPLYREKLPFGFRRKNDNE